jgi:hypothetical protein
MAAKAEARAQEVRRRKDLEQVVDELVEAIRKYLLFLVDGASAPRRDLE